jgi:hypothetical protein
MNSVSKLLYSPFFQNKFVLYGSLILVLLAIIRYLANHNFNAIILMTLIAFLMTYFSKNMIIILLTAFFAVLFMELSHGTMMVEGMKTKEGGEDESENAESENAESENAESENAESENAEGKKTEDAEEDNKKPKSKPKTTVEGADGQKPANKPDHKPEEHPKEASKKQGMAKLNPASYNGKDGDDSKTSNNGNRIDYASTLEQAYDNIENIIGEDGVRGLTDQTKSLMNQQKDLMNNMKDIEPLLKSAQGFMTQMAGEGGLSGISKMLQGFSGSK